MLRPYKNRARWLLLRGIVGGPAEDDADFGGVVALGAGHDEGLAIRGNVVTGDGGAGIELAIEEFDWLAGLESRAQPHRNAHDLGAVSIDNFAAVAHPARLIAAVGGDLPETARTGNGLNVNFGAAGFIGGVGHPMPIGRETALPLDCGRALERAQFVGRAHAEKPEVDSIDRVRDLDGCVISGDGSDMAGLRNGAEEFRLRRAIGGNTVDAVLSGGIESVD